MILLLLLLAVPAPTGARLLQQGKPAEAAALLEKQLAREPRNAALANDLGFAYARLGRTADAERLYRRAIELSPARLSAWANLADLLGTLPARWQRADEIVAFLAQGLAAVPPGAFAILSVRVADFERSVGRTAQARARLSSLRELQLTIGDERRIRELEGRIEQEERGRATEDWPEPAVPPEALAELARAASLPPPLLLGVVDRLIAQRPAWQAARWLRALTLESVGRIDEAARELAVLTQLAPSHARAWRRLGEILAVQGGLLEAERADEALRQALSLEPSWSELWLLRARVALRRGRAQDALLFLRRAPGSDEARRLEQLAHAQDVAGPLSAAARPPPLPPTPEARALYQQALLWRLEPELARGDLLRALQLSPGFVEAAAALYLIDGAVPAATVAGLQDDGPGLLELSAQLRRAGAPALLVAPWIDRAVELGAPEALYDRARLRLDQGERAGALADLVAYVASAPRPPHLDDARALRAQLVPGPPVDAAEVQARLQLADDRPEAALAALGGRCGAGLPAARLLALGQVHEFAGALADAATCYQLAAHAPGAATGLQALQRLSRVAARAPSPALASDLRAAAARGIPDAEWALARLEPSQPHLDRFLAAAPEGDPFLAEARAAKASLERSTLLAQARRQRRNLALLLLGLALLLAAAYWRWAGATVEVALARAPSLFPALLRSVAEVRHDVIKHRASALGLAGENRAEVARALLEPTCASQVVARTYERLRAAARAQGVSMRRLSREPSFGPLVRDLARAEALLRGPGPTAGLAALDVRIRTVHAQRMAGLLRLGPRTRLTATAVAAWIDAVEAEVRQGGAAWTSPSILLQGMEVEFPVEQAALSTIFTNLLRNAQAAAAPDGRVLVRLARERDAAGRDLHVLLVGDSAAGGISLDAIESRESGRGLAIVRDLTREWHGHLIVRPEAAPFSKAVGACFPAPAI